MLVLATTNAQEKKNTNQTQFLLKNNVFTGTGETAQWSREPAPLPEDPDFNSQH